MNFTIELQKSHIRAALIFAAKKDIRLYLNAVAVEVGDPGKTGRLTATDGHTLLTIDSGTRPDYGAQAWDGQARTVIVPRQFLEPIKKPKRDEFVTLAVEGESFTLSDAFNGAQTAGPLCDAWFPDWRRVVPAEFSGELAQFNPEFLVRFQKAAAELGFTKTAPVVLHNGNAGAGVGMPVPDAFGVIMPFRHDPLSMRAPEWVHAMPVAEPAGEPTKEEQTA